MYKIVDRQPYNLSGGKNIDLCDIVSDTVSDLPTGEALSINRIGFGSFAYVVDTGETKVLNSSGVWK